MVGKVATVGGREEREARGASGPLASCVSPQPASCFVRQDPSRRDSKHAMSQFVQLRFWKYGLLAEQSHVADMCSACSTVC